jgi:hypothetical protein
MALAGLATPQEVEALLDRAWSLVQRHRPLLEEQAFSHAFYTERQYERLVPSEWRDALSTASTDDIARMAAGHVPAAAPPTLRAFITATHECRLGPMLLSGAPASEDAAVAAAAAAAAVPTHDSGKTQRWRQGAGPKKVTECAHLGRRVQELACAATEAAASGSDGGGGADSLIVDVGCGKGYLSSMLASNGCSVLALDGRAALTTAASGKDRAAAARPAAGGERVPPTYIAMRLGAGGSNGGGPTTTSEIDGGDSSSSSSSRSSRQPGAADVCRTCSVDEAAIEIPQV